MDDIQNEQDQEGRVLEPFEPHYPTIVVIHRNTDNGSTASYQNQASIDFRYMIFTATSTETLSVFLRHIRWSVVRTQHANFSHVNDSNNGLVVTNILRHDSEFWNHINNIRQRGYVPFRSPFMCLVVANDVNIVDYVTREEEDLGHLVQVDATDFEIIAFQRDNSEMFHMSRQERNFLEDESDGEKDFDDPQKFIFSDSSKYIEKYHLFPEKCDEKQINLRKEQVLGELETVKNFPNSVSTITLLTKKRKHRKQKKENDTKDLIHTALLLELESNEMHICILRDNSEIRMSHNCSANGTDQSQIKAFRNDGSGLPTFFKPISSDKTSSQFSNASSTGSTETLSRTYISERKNTDVIDDTEVRNHSEKPIQDNGNSGGDIIPRYREIREAFNLPGFESWIDSFGRSNLEDLFSIHYSGTVSQPIPDADTFTVFLLDESDSIDNEGINIMRSTVNTIVLEKSDKDSVAVVRIGQTCSLPLYWNTNKCEIFDVIADFPSACGGPTPLAFGFFISTWLLSKVRSSLVRIVLLSDGHPTRSTTESTRDPPQDICVDEDNVREEIQDVVVPYLREHRIPVFTVPCSCEDQRDKLYLRRLSQKTGGQIYPDDQKQTRNITLFHRYLSIQRHAERLVSRFNVNDLNNREEMLEQLSDYIRDTEVYIDLVADEISNRLRNRSTSRQ